MTLTHQPSDARRDATGRPRHPHRLARAFACALLTCGVAATVVIALPGERAAAHGYIGGDGVRARAVIGNADIGAAQWDKQSLEADGGFPERGPADGAIASAGGSFGRQLDEQSASRWIKNVVGQGPTRIDWHYTAPHRTAGWKFFLTRPGWNQNAPLTRRSLELISQVAHDGSVASNRPGSHTVIIPVDRTGYHVLVAVWNIADTPMAFYNVADLWVEPRGVAAPYARLAATATHVEGANVLAPLPPIAAADAAAAHTSHGGSQAHSGHDATHAAPSATSSPGRTVSSTPSAPSRDASFNPDLSYAVGQVVSYGGRFYRALLPSHGVAPGVLIWAQLPLGTPGPVALPDHTTSVPVASAHAGTRPKQTTASTPQAVVAQPRGSASSEDSRPQHDHSGAHRDHSSEPQEPSTGSRAIATDPPAQITGESIREWSSMRAYRAGDRVTWKGAVYRAEQAYQGYGDENWINAPSLWSRVAQ